MPWPRDSKSSSEPTAIYSTNEYQEAFKALGYVSFENSYNGKEFRIFIKCLVKNSAGLFAILL